MINRVFSGAFTACVTIALLLRPRRGFRNNAVMQPRFISLCGALAVLAGCTGSQPPIGTPATTRISSMRARQPTSQALLYVSSIYGYYEVNVYTLPQGDLVGPLNITYEPQAMCADDAGDVFIPEASFNTGMVAEYAHGATDPMRVYQDPDGPYACAIDPTTRNLAVANQKGTISIFDGRSNSPTPKVYSNSAVESFFFTSYDSNGDLYVTAFAFGSAYRLYELRKGTSTLKQVKVPFQICCPEWIQWDGAYLAIEVPKFKGAGPIVYRLSVSDYKATIAGRLVLDGGNNGTAQSWIDGKTLVHPDDNNEELSLFNYPEGGKAWESFRSVAADVFGVTVSNAK
jgi:hypothetical protein